MSRRTLVFSFALATLMSGAMAQQKVIKLSEGNADAPTLTYYPISNLIQPTVASAVICAPAGQQTSAQGLATALSKKGVPVFMAAKSAGNLNAADVKSALQYVQTHTADYQVTTGKTGLINLADGAELTGDLPFLALLNPPAKAGKIAGSMPVLLSVNGNNPAGTSMYNNIIKNGGQAELHLHNRPVADSVQYQEVISWMGDLGLLKPISTERTVERKKADDWANFGKSVEDRIHNDWPWIKRYEGDNERMPAPAPGEKRVIFMGNSITEGWINTDPEFFKSHGYINRGIGGQTTPQMLVRFREDIINLHAKVVIILAGINDIAENTGPNKLENVAGNIISMAELAKANGIKVIFCSVLPAAGFPWHPSINPVNSIIRLNEMLRAYAEKNKLGYVNYYDALVDENKAFKKPLAIDGVHPNLAGYKIMEPLAEAMINKILAQP